MLQVKNNMVKNLNTVNKNKVILKKFNLETTTTSFTFQNPYHPSHHETHLACYSTKKQNISFHL